MQNVVIEPTNYSPRVQFDLSGVLSIKGRSLMLNAVAFYDPLIEWATLLNAPSVSLSIELDYINTASSKKLFDLLKILDQRNNGSEFNVYWAFETDDEDILVKGQIFAEKLKNAKFLFTELAGV